MIWSFDVTVSTHDDLRRGITELRLGQQAWHRVVVEADDYWDAFDSVYAMAAHPGYEVTGMYLRI